jgi:hypothetical protein
MNHTIEYLFTFFVYMFTCLNVYIFTFLHFYILHVYTFTNLLNIEYWILNIAYWIMSYLFDFGFICLCAYVLICLFAQVNNNYQYYFIFFSI